MEIIPSLYLQDGKIVSWYKGQQNEQKKIYYKEPLHMARFFASEGATKLQIIDLGGTLSGQLQHTGIIKQICRNIDSEVQLGGGIRTMEEVARAFDLGAGRVLLGVSSIKILKEALEKYGPDKIVMGIKGNYNKVDTDFTMDGGVPEVTDLAKEVQKVGVTQLVYKDMQTEGALYHPNFDMIEKIIFETEGKMDIYSSGGTADEYDLKLLREAGAKGVIIGRAFMENALDFKKLMEMYS